ncbi:MAG: hypothetical protein NT027_10850, partial [Proteobacteria bacterium]|nr:hypothetical protein [Pseudomonadota bacterium]
RSGLCVIGVFFEQAYKLISEYWTYHLLEKSMRVRSKALIMERQRCHVDNELLSLRRVQKCQT